MQPFVSGENLEWIDARDNPPPLNVKMLVLGRGGIADIRNFLPEYHVAYCPLPKIQPELKKWLSDMHSHLGTPVNELYQLGREDEHNI